MKKLLHVISPVLGPPVFFKCGKLLKKSSEQLDKIFTLATLWYGNFGRVRRENIKYRQILRFSFKKITCYNFHENYILKI